MGLGASILLPTTWWLCRRIRQTQGSVWTSRFVEDSTDATVQQKQVIDHLCMGHV